MSAVGARFLDRLRAGPAIVADGGTGTERLRCGTGAADVHRAFVAAGAELVVADTIALARMAGGEAASRMAAAIADARASGARWVAASLGPLQVEIAPSARLRAYAGLASAAATAGADVVFAETLLSLEDASAALDASRAAGIPVAVSFAFGPDGKGFGDLTVDAVARWARAARPDAAGFNCGVDPGSVLEAGRRFAGLVPEMPLSLRPAASAPGRSAATPEEMAAFGREAASLGTRLIGGCCGATPAHIRALAGEVRK